MTNSEKIAHRIAFMMKGNGLSTLNLSAHDKFGFDHPVILCGGSDNGNGDWENYEVYALHITMDADTNFGKVDLLEADGDENDWLVLEKVVKELLGY